jgi:hypothetical protein
MRRAPLGGDSNHPTEAESWQTARFRRRGHCASAATWEVDLEYLYLWAGRLGILEELHHIRDSRDL